MHPALLIGAGFLLGTAGVKVIKSEPARKAAVKTLAQGLRIKEDAQTLVDQAKAEFDDLVAEATYVNDQKEVKIETVDSQDEED